jgi:hypothetical protein
MAFRILPIDELDPISVAGPPFTGFQFAIPAYAGPGAYDLAAIAARDGADDWDPFWFQLWLGSTDEPFYWTQDYGPASVTVAPDEHTLTLRMSMQNAAGTNIALESTITLP